MENVLLNQKLILKNLFLDEDEWMGILSGISTLEKLN
jgi:hypothetical protein